MRVGRKDHRHPIMEAGNEIVGRAVRVCDRLHSVGALVAAGMRRHAARLDRQREGTSSTESARPQPRVVGGDDA
jgi:hypothetical protein